MEECQRGELLGRDGAEFRVECGLHKALEKTCSQARYHDTQVTN